MHDLSYIGLVYRLRGSNGWDLVLKEIEKMSSGSNKPKTGEHSGFFAFVGALLLGMGFVYFVAIWWHWNPYGSDASLAKLASQIFQAITAFFVAWLGYIAIAWSYKLAESE